MNGRAIGIIGGMGAATSIHFEQSLQQFVANGESGLLDVIHVSMPARIPDRTEFLLGKVSENPALSAGEIALSIQSIAHRTHSRLALCVPCNTFHVPAIWNEFKEIVAAQALMELELVSMVDALQMALRQAPILGNKLGVLCTTGSRQRRLFEAPLAAAGYRCFYVDEELQHELMDAIYSLEWGLKRHGRTTDASQVQLQRCVDDLVGKKVSGLIFGCTELVLAKHALDCHGVEFIDPMSILATAVIKGPGSVQMCGNQVKRGNLV